MALVRDHVVQNIIRAPSEEFSVDGYDCRVLTADQPCGIGWIEVGDEYAEPEVELSPEPLAPIDFMRRFTPAEWIAIDSARATDGMVRYVMALFEAALSVRLDHPDTIAALGYFVHVGLLTQERADEILRW